MNTIYKITSFTLLAGVLFLTGCSPSDTEKQTQEVAPPKQQEQSMQKDFEKQPAKGELKITDAQKVQAYVDEQNRKMEAMSQEVDYYKQYAKDMILILPSDKVQELINKEYHYAVTINNIQFPQSGILEIRETAFDIVFTEDRVKFSVLPESESVKGKIPTDLEDAVSTSASPQTKDEDGKTILTYSYKDLKPGERISFKISDELKKKLSVNTNELVVKVLK
ncbi:major membrane immunogen (membrane-anchored lipoprotein) [Paenibacillus sp. 1182]|uniref:hypothetical protein n=1 Tax=Paenibacillus sp. 1182 TaxID=2806565 RepID=UPI001AE7430C|nr:hypothetical protein [Paenibacillus sp. 1182]MBP1308833.1 major membrane immunogen (membrane-anchored lipoprotein) [Paenibacillus sp. 1182]